MVSATSATDRRTISGLPAEVTSFVGRRHEVAEVRRLLSLSRMVTLTGVGGVGKTRLAIRVGTLLRRSFAGGVWLVELADLSDPDLLIPAVAETLRVRANSPSSSVDVLIEHLQGRQALIILDNCEHLLTTCAVMCDALLRSLPDLHILTTSRQALGTASEQTLAVPPLTLLASGQGADPGCSEAVRLFAQRAEAVVPGFSVTDDNREAVEAICRHLDGLPLGIELAAVRLRVLSVQQLLSRLDDRFRLLTCGPRAVLPRHQTLGALIEWSYALCTDAERTLWARVSVFSGGLDIDAAEQVCANIGIPRDDVLNLVIGLVDKSVLIREEHGQVVRYRLLETIRQYGRERLADSGTEATLCRNHRDYYRRMAAEARAELFGPHQVAWLNRLRTEHANLRVALDYCFTEPGEAMTGMEMACDLLYHWISSFYLLEGRTWLERGLAAVREPEAPRARALWTTSWLALIQAEPDDAARMLREARSIGERLHLESVLAYTALYSGVVAMNAGDTTAAIACYEEALDRHRASDDPVGEALALVRLSLAHSFLNDSARSIAYGEESLKVCDRHGELWHKAYTTMALGVEVWREGDTARAAALERESLRANRELDDPLGSGVNMEVLAWIAATDGDYERATRLLGIAGRTWEAIGAPMSGYGYLVQYHDACVSATRAALGEGRYRAGFEAGAALSHGEGLAYALGEQAPAAASRGTSPLTRREREIARLVAQGLSNKEIAAKLVISQRTAEGHVEHILDKLGFNSRARIAAWVSEQGPATLRDGPSGGDTGG